jgi:hypothetical protein
MQAVFDFEMIAPGLQGQVYGPRPDEHDRLLGAGDQSCKELGDSGAGATTTLGSGS